ncbi:MAG: lamin tail domain-containing protein [Planctomycetales bacterium]|nr:lamin tail domain-containing protein [Planctomycetales bacterium]
MKFCTLRLFLFAVAAVIFALPSHSLGQVVINELVYDIAGESPDLREYVELYNAGGSAVDISNWTVGFYDVSSAFTFSGDVIPSNTMLGAGDYYVLGSTGVPNLDQDIQTGGIDLYPDGNTVIELRDSSSALVDALGYEFNKGTSGISAEQFAQTGPNGWWGNTQSYNIFPTQLSLGRYRDGADSDFNGRDFGNIISTPGTSNNLPFVAQHTIPDVDAMTVGAEVPGYYASFVNATVIDPGVVDTNNPNIIPPSPQGGLAVTAWDPSGGGNAVYSSSLVNGYDLYAYLDPTPYGVTATTNDIEYESTTYGIGTTGTLHNTPDPTGAIFGDVTTANGSTGIGWVFQKEEQSGYYSLLLVDANDGGPSNPASADWTVIQQIDFSSESAAWHRLGLDYDPTTGDVTATFDDQTFQFTTATDIAGTFYVGYREGITNGGGSGANTPVLRPPTFDMVAAVAADDADFNDDTIVDGADFLIWQRNYLATGANNSMGDANGDGDVTAADLTVWQSQFGTTLAAGAVGAVPEPATILLGIACSAGIALSGRRRR